MSLFDDASELADEYLPEYELTGNLLQGYASTMESLAPDLYTYMGQKVAYILLGIVFSIACLVYATYRLGKKQIPVEEFKGVLIFVVLLAVNGHIGTQLWFGVHALITFSTNISKGMLESAADLIGVPLEPITGEVTHPIAKLAGILDAQVGNIGDLGFAMLDDASVWSYISSAQASASSFLFGLLIVFVFAVVSFFYAFLLVRSHAYIMFVFIFSPLIIPCAGLKVTRGVAKAAFKTLLNGACMLIAPTIGLCLVVTIISATKRMAGCLTHYKTEYKTQCAAEIETIKDVFGIQIPEITTITGAIDFYMLLIGIGLLSILLIFVFARAVSNIFGGPMDASPIAIIAASMAAIKTAGVVSKGGKIAGNATGTVAGKGGSLLVGGVRKLRDRFGSDGI
jgi:hypothetical protein